jgi:ankyrin repeat protein
MFIKPLHTAVWNASDAATVKLLLDKDEDGGTVRKKIEFRGDAKNTRAWRVVPLHLAVKRGIPEVIRLLLMKEKNIKDARKEVKRGIPEGIRRPKKKYKRNSTQDFLINSTLEMKDYKGRTPLHIACQKGADVNITQSLLDADPLNKALHELDHNGFKPFHHSCNKADATPEVVQLLLNEEEKMHLTFTGKKRMTSSIDKRNRSPLYLALSKGAPESVIEILTRPEYFYLKGLDVVVLEKLATIVSQNDVIQDNVIKKLSDRSYFTVLFVELYAYIIAVFAFLEGSENLLQNQRITWEPVVLVVSIVLFLLREVAQIKSEGISYVKDKWSWLEVASTILLSICVKEMFQEEFVMEPTLFTVTGILLILQFIFYLRATFLPFATFVGGLLQIFNDLVPFYVVSFLLLLAFTFAFVALEGYEGKYKCRELPFVFLVFISLNVWAVCRKMSQHAGMPPL